PKMSKVSPLLPWRGPAMRNGQSCILLTRNLAPATPMEAAQHHWRRSDPHDKPNSPTNPPRTTLACMPPQMLLLLRVPSNEQRPRLVSYICVLRCHPIPLASAGVLSLTTTWSVY